MSTKETMMNQALAKYLFENEVLYQEPTVLTESFEDSKIAKNQEISKIEEKPTETPIQKEIENSEIVSKIELKHKVLILTAPITDSEKELLNKILGAVGLTFDQIDFVIFEQSKGLDYKLILSQKITTHFISFGIGMSKLGWSMLLAPYQLKKIENINFLLTDNLKDIESSQNLKKSLWGALKVFFI